MRRPVLPAVVAVLLVLVTLPLALGAGPATAADRVRDRARDRQVVSREVVFEVDNTTSGTLTSLGCPLQPDRREHRVRATIVGPRHVVVGRGGVETFHLLVHDAGTGGWFWNLRGTPTYDYAGQLARQGETSVVLDRLGYDRSPLPGRATCLAAQAEVLHQVVQHLYAGTYAKPGRPRENTQNAAHVVTHGHGTGATITQLEAARYRDVDGVVLMSPTSTSPTTAALRVLQQQSLTCLGGAGSAAYGASAAEFRRLLFASAPAAVQRAAAARRNPTPCGDVASLAQTVLEAGSARLHAPALVLTGSRDGRNRAAAAVASDDRVVRRTVAGAGSALPLERQAPAVRREVLRFVRSL
ncbi:alpha/beta hydrolase [Nocardioides litoris]|uniref:alpha/beta hydrolase n=1 Tax=Nocardioides litoris TaxID=1926648 RepID=UPI001476BA72|nr:hypothetical protein [Nocardioides litoris]